MFKKVMEKLENAKPLTVLAVSTVLVLVFVLVMLWVYPNDRIWH